MIKPTGLATKIIMDFSLKLFLSFFADCVSMLKAATESAEKCKKSSVSLIILSGQKGNAPKCCACHAKSGPCPECATPAARNGTAVAKPPRLPRKNGDCQPGARK